MFDDDKEELAETREGIIAYLETLRLRLHEEGLRDVRPLGT